MGDPVLGNNADELAQYEEGKDFAGINRGAVPEMRPMVPVRITEVPGGVAIAPDSPSEEFKQGVPELREGAEAITKAQVFDDPFMERGGSPESVAHSVVAGMMKLLTMEMRVKTPARDKLIFYRVRPRVGMASFGERIIVMQDTVESEYSCRECKGKGYNPEAVCGLCLGEVVGRNECKNCKVLGFGRDEMWSCGRRKCGPCNGSGWRGGIVIPDEHQKMSISGIVVSVGPECVNLRVGDRVLHSRYAGQTLTNPGDNNKYTTMLESEVTNLLMDLPE